MGYTMETSAQDVADRLSKQIAGEIETRIRENLMARATEIVNEVARELAKDVLSRTTEVRSMQEPMSMNTILHLYVGVDKNPETFRTVTKVVGSKDDSGILP